MTRSRGGLVPRFLASMVVVVILAGGCSSEGSPSAATEIATPWHVAVDRESLAPPGTLLAPGIEVQEGSSRVGPTFPLLYHSNHPDSSVIGWQALLVVEGDPVDVWNRYVDALGYGEDARAAHRCSVGKADQPAVGSRSLTQPASDGEDQLDCRLPEQMVMTVGASSICLVGPCPRRSVGHLYLSVRTKGLSDAPDVPPTTAVAGRTVIAPQLTTSLPSRLPTVGERYDDSLDYALNENDADALVPPGARSLVAPALVNPGCISSSVAMLDMSDDPAAAVATFGTVRNPVISRRLGTRAGNQWATGHQGTPDGYALTITAVEAGHGHSTVLLHNCGN